MAGGDEHITFLHRYVGNPILTVMLNGLFGTKYSDVYCGFRAFSRSAYDRIEPVSPGMEYNLELAINAGLSRLATTEIPIKLAPRKGSSKLNTFKDGWRSLRLMLLYCPNKFFLYPGGTLFVFGSLLHATLLAQILRGLDPTWVAVIGIAATILTVVGTQIISLGLQAKTYSWSHRFDHNNQALTWFYKYFNLEIGLSCGAFLLLSGFLIVIYLLFEWVNRRTIPQPDFASLAATLIMVGINVVFSTLLTSAMSMSRKNAPGTHILPEEQESRKIY